MTLGRDFTSITTGRFTGRLVDATLTVQPESAYDSSDPTAAPTGEPTDYECEGLAFTYETRFIDGERIIKGDYRVVVLRGSLEVLPKPGDKISIPPPGETSGRNGTVILVEAITEAAITMQVRGA